MSDKFDNEKVIKEIQRIRRDGFKPKSIGLRPEVFGEFLKTTYYNDQSVVGGDYPIYLGVPVETFPLQKEKVRVYSNKFFDYTPNEIKHYIVKNLKYDSMEPRPSFVDQKGKFHGGHGLGLLFKVYIPFMVTKVSARKAKQKKAKVTEFAMDEWLGQGNFVDFNTFTDIGLDKDANIIQYAREEAIQNAFKETMNILNKGYYDEDEVNEKTGKVVNYVRKWVSGVYLEKTLDDVRAEFKKNGGGK